MMRIDVLTLFPQIIQAYADESIVRRAQEKNLARIYSHNIRNFSTLRHARVDERPFGGGAGMVLMAEPILRGVDHIKQKARRKAKSAKPKIIILSARGKPFNQTMAYEWSKKSHLILISGRYEGIDERVTIGLGAEEISIGPYVLTDGDVAALAIISSVVRLLPGAIKEESSQNDSFSQVKSKKDSRFPLEARLAKGGKIRDSGYLEYPHYTRPEVLRYKGKRMSVPKILLSGNHKQIAAWRVSRRRASPHRGRGAEKNR